LDNYDQDFILAILQVFEKVYFRNLALEALLGVQPIPGWENLVEKFTSDPQIQPETRAAFRSLRRELGRGQSPTDLARALQELLKLLPTSGKVQ
jgi:hypothetical protein